MRGARGPQLYQRVLSMDFHVIMLVRKAVWGGGRALLTLVSVGPV